MGDGREILHRRTFSGLSRMPRPWDLSKLGCVVDWDDRPSRAFSTTVKWPWAVEVELVLE